MKKKPLKITYHKIDDDDLEKRKDAVTAYCLGIAALIYVYKTIYRKAQKRD